MEHEHSVVAKNIRLQNWANDIRDCQNSDLTVAQWCEQHGIGIKNYYYRMKKVREAYLREHPVPKALTVDSGHTEPRFTELLPPPADIIPDAKPAVISAGHIRIEISENISDAFLRKIIQVLADAV